jgi:hypothetical protein
MAAGLAALGAAFNREVTPQVAKIYHGVLGAKLNPEQWERAVRRSLESEAFFPPPAVLLRFGAANGAPQARALEVYERVVNVFESGHYIGPRDVDQIFGGAALEAFVAAGGTRAFRECELRDEPFRRKAWLEAWLETTEQDPTRGILPETCEAHLKFLDAKRMWKPWQPPPQLSDFVKPKQLGEGDDRG